MVRPCRVPARRYRGSLGPGSSTRRLSFAMTDLRRRLEGRHRLPADLRSSANGPLRAGRPDSAQSTARMSSGSVTRVAPAFKRRWCLRHADRGRSRERRTLRGPVRRAKPRGDQRARATAASTTTRRRDKPEMNRLRRGKWRARLDAQRHFGDEQRRARRSRVERGVLRRIDISTPPASTATVPARARLMGRRIDAAGKARDDDKPASPKRGRQLAGEIAARRAEPLRAPTMATTGVQRAELAHDVEQRRRRHRPRRAPADSPARHGDERCAPSARGLQLGLGIGLAGRCGCAWLRPPGGQHRAAVERRLGAAEWLTSARKVTGPTVSLRIRRSQAKRCAAKPRRLRPWRLRSGLGGCWRRSVGSSPRSRRAIFAGMAPIEDRSEQQEQRRIPHRRYKTSK